MAPDADPPTRSDDCMACRGTGQVTSSLGGEPRLVACPWCEGSGVRLAGHDAQARWREAGVGVPVAEPAA
jgi:DnaJ-class molecular chaperone